MLGAYGHGAPFREVLRCCDAGEHAPCTAAEHNAMQWSRASEGSYRGGLAFREWKLTWKLLMLENQLQKQMENEMETRAM